MAGNAKVLWELVMKSNPLPIPLDTLLAVERVNRLPLRDWAADLVQKVASIDASQRNWLEIASAMNNASLIEVFRGRPRDAWGLCELQLRWAERVAQEHGSVGVELMLQPWINQARLLRIQGEIPRARERFAFLPNVLTGRAVRIGTLTFDATTFRAFVDERNLWDFLQSVYVVDSTKSYLLAGDSAAAVSFLREAAAMMDSVPVALFDEMELICLLQLGRYREAMAVTERSSWQADGYTKMVRVTYRIALLSALGSREAARGLAEQLAERVLAGKFATPKDQRVLRYLHHFGALTRHLELDTLAARVFQLGLSASRHLVDVPLELSFLESLLALEGVADRDVLSADRDTLLRECLYVTLLKPRGLEVDPIAAADPVFYTLRSKLEEVTGSFAINPLTEARAA
jgi:hypothetical protein